MGKRGMKPCWETDVCEDLPTLPGIYIIWFDGGTRAYIGCSNNIQKRVRTHLYEMQGYFDHKMKSDLKRFGEGACCAAVLEIVGDLSRLPDVETYWIERYLAGGWKLYNTEMKGKVHHVRKGAR